MNDQTNADPNQVDEAILAAAVSDESLEAAAGINMGGQPPTFFLPTGYFQCC